MFITVNILNQLFLIYKLQKIYEFSLKSFVNLTPVLKHEVIWIPWS